MGNDEDDAWRAFCDFVKHPHPHRDADPREPWEVITRPAKPKPKQTRKRKVTLTRALKQADKAGVLVSGATVKPDGSVALELGNKSNGASLNDDLNEWDSVKQ
jgi:hypothetical protein